MSCSYVTSKCHKFKPTIIYLYNLFSLKNALLLDDLCYEKNVDEFMKIFKIPLI